MKYFITLIFFVTASTIFAQKDTMKVDLSEIVITATKTETPLRELASSLSVITSEEISRKQKNNVVDILREVPGISIVQQGGPGKLSNVFIRGANPGHALVLIDGVEMNDPSTPNNIYDLSSLQSNNIERIEIVRGPQSTLYGSDAMAGVINIITKTGGGKQKLNISTEGGSNNYYKAGINASGSYSVFNYLVNISRLSTDGISSISSKYGNVETDKFQNDMVNAKLGMNIINNLKLNLNYRYSYSKSDLDQFDRLGDDPNFYYNLEEQLYKGELNYDIPQLGWEQKFSASFLRRLTHSGDAVDDVRPDVSSYNYTHAAKTKFDWQNTIDILKNNRFTLGIETELEKANTDYYSTSAWGEYNSFFPVSRARTTGYYLHDQINLFNSLFSTIGIRYDDHERFGGVTTYRFATAYYISKTNTKVKFTYGTGFKAPSLYYLNDPMFGNPELRPEKSRGWDAGIEQFFANQNISIGVTYFYSNFSDLFGFDENFKTINIAEARSSGIEAFVNFKLIPKIDINANYTFNETEDVSPESADYEMPLLRRAKHTANLSVNYQFNEELNFNASARYKGKRDDKDFSTFPVSRVALSDYTLFNFAASYKIYDFLKITGRIENIFDKYYEEVLFYGSLGRSFYAGLEMNL
ncbi:MAG: TonB-dependent receptor [Melioribacteraceae bacterium]|nr:TonB-dependent receptor [Melioribacteraceae bacterium]MCF8354156.1 TonB-dependent receptor [Melioribacteraceae bacterium]MCF8396030.1 TonB-dependent receptor [Melioribacteraceae bacterium]MCF8418079.1 TonB-dependent receptor [Melioribacteraceae bacterium]